MFKIQMIFNKLTRQTVKYNIDCFRGKQDFSAHNVLPVI